MGYGDINASNTSERVGYVMLFIMGGFIWGNLLAGISEIHSAQAAREQEKMSKVQKVVDFLVENNCPRR